MTRIHVICEGQTEETFVNEVLIDALRPKGIELIPALLGKPGHKGGHVNFERVLTDVRIRLLGDRKAWCTTLFDFYGLAADFPGKAAARHQTSAAAKASCVQAALTEALLAKLGDEAMRRFIPYVQMHEFEGLLFSDPSGLAQGINQLALEQDFRLIREQFDTPESINDNPSTAPSKRIKKLFAAYDKPLHGALAAIEIGLPPIREQCTHFDDSLCCIEALSR